MNTDASSNPTSMTFVVQKWDGPTHATGQNISFIASQPLSSTFVAGTASTTSFPNTPTPAGNVNPTTGSNYPGGAPSSSTSATASSATYGSIAVPTLGAWAMMLFGGVAAIGGAWMVHRRVRRGGLR
jgi:hypothetical protein